MHSYTSCHLTVNMRIPYSLDTFEGAKLGGQITNRAMPEVRLRMIEGVHISSVGGIRQ